MSLKASERTKYETVWGEYPAYRSQADGDPVVDLAFDELGCKPGESLIDWGCGKGTPAQKFQDKGLVVTGFDIAHNCLDPGITVPLVVGCLWEKPNITSDYSFCTDVLEHIPPEHLDAAISVIYACTRKAAFIQVCVTHDTFGAKHMDPPQVLHLSVMSSEVWASKLVSAGWQIRLSGNLGKSRWWAVVRKSIIPNALILMD